MNMIVTGKLVLPDGEEIHIEVDGECVAYQAGPAEAYVKAKETLMKQKDKDK